MKINKLTKYGFRLDSGEMVYATPEVMNFVSKSLPCEIEVLEEKPYGKSKKQITKVKVITNKLNEFTTPKNKTPQEIRPKVDSGNTLSLAVQIFLSQKQTLEEAKYLTEKGILKEFKTLHSICQELVKEFKYLEGELR